MAAGQSREEDLSLCPFESFEYLSLCCLLKTVTKISNCLEEQSLQKDFEMNKGL